MNTETVNLSQVQINSANPRTITNEKFEKLVNSILALPKMLVLRPIVVDNMMTALGGNMRYRALTAISDLSEDELRQRLSAIRDIQKKTQAEQDNLLHYWLRWKDKPTAIVIKASELTDEEQREFIIKDNVGFGDWDMDALANEWDIEELADWGVDSVNPDWGDNETGGEISTSSGQNSPAESSLFDRFIVPPFSILDTRKGYWQDRKKMWYERMGDLGQSRSDKLVTSLEIKYKDLYQRTREHRKELGISFKEYLDKYVTKEDLEREQAKIVAQGVSIFDPVVSELMCKWFTPNSGSKIFDCFAGDTAKGLVFSICGFKFTGIELRPEQVEINKQVIMSNDADAVYICDDGQNVANHIEAESQDMLFSCPPYFDLEKYSDLPNDASNQGSYEDFIQILQNAFTAAIACLKENRFAVIVVGDVRDKNTGFYYDFCGDIKRIFRENGVRLYNEIILVEQTASTALRASRYMDSRKVAKTHQHILVFFKGNPKKIKDEFQKIEYTDEDMKKFNEEEAGENNVIDETSPNDELHNTNLDIVLKELVKFKEPYIKKKLVSYQPYPRIKEALANGEIHIERDDETGAIIGYLWLINLKKKPVSRIWEICSARKGLGRKLIERAINTRKHETLELYVVDYNDNAISFYEHMGFVETEREQGKKINNVTMQYKGL